VWSAAGAVSQENNTAASTANLKKQTRCCFLNIMQITFQKFRQKKAVLKIVRATDKDFAAKIREATSDSSLFDAEIEQRTKAILHDVFVRGDDAVLDFTEKFDGAKLSADQLAVTQAELMAASLKADESLRAAVAEAQANIAGFAKKSKCKDWSGKNSHGASVGEKFDPFQRVGIYIPGGTAPLVSTALMTITLAKVAGCKEIVVTTPCGKD